MGGKSGKIAARSGNEVATRWQGRWQKRQCSDGWRRYSRCQVWACMWMRSAYLPLCEDCSRCERRWWRRDDRTNLPQESAMVKSLGGEGGCVLRNDLTASHPARLWVARARAFAASWARSLGGMFVSSALRRSCETAAMASTAARKAASLALEGVLKPLILRTNCNEAA